MLMPLNYQNSLENSFHYIEFAILRKVKHLSFTHGVMANTFIQNIFLSLMLPMFVPIRINDRLILQDLKCFKKMRRPLPMHLLIMYSLLDADLIGFFFRKIRF